MSPARERSRLSREHIVQEALVLLEEVGLVELSLRKLAARLGVTAPTLYWHFASRQDLIDAMADELMSHLTPPESGASGGPLRWDEWMQWAATSCREAMLARRDGALLMSMSRPSSRQWSDVGQVMTLFLGAGFSPPAALVAIGTMMDFIVGGVLEEQQRVNREPAGGLGFGLAPRDEPGRLRRLAVGERFDAGIEIIVAGLRSRLSSAG